jgi:hypothetical protein
LVAVVVDLHLQDYMEEVVEQVDLENLLELLQVVIVCLL